MVKINIITWYVRFHFVKPKLAKLILLVWRLAASMLLPGDKPQTEGSLGA